MSFFHAISIGQSGLLLTAPSSGAAVGKAIAIISGSGNRWQLGLVDFPVVDAAAIEAALGYIPADVDDVVLKVDLATLISAIAWPTTDPEVAGAVWSNKGILTISDGVGGIGNWRVGQTFVVS